MAADSDLRIDVVGCYRVWTLRLSPGATIRDAVHESGAIAFCPEFSWDCIGVYGLIQPPDTPLRDGDRVEIYRPLKRQPRQARLVRAQRKNETS